MPAMRTNYRHCRHCGTCVIFARGVPALSYFPDPAGSVAAEQTVSGVWKGRFLSQDRPIPVAPEKRYRVHFCDDAETALR